MTWKGGGGVKGKKTGGREICRKGRLKPVFLFMQIHCRQGKEDKNTTFSILGLGYVLRFSILFGVRPCRVKTVA